jgi:hypothetical protein
MTELSGPASGAASAHTNKRLDGSRELDSVRPVTTAVAAGARPASDAGTWEGGEAGVCPCDFGRLDTPLARAGFKDGSASPGAGTIQTPYPLHRAPLTNGDPK